MWIDEAAQEKDARKKWIFTDDLKGIMLAFTQALQNLIGQFGRVNWVSLVRSKSWWYLAYHVLAS